MENKNITRLNYQMIFEEEKPRKQKEDTHNKLVQAELLHKEKIKYWQEQLKTERERAYNKGFNEGKRIGRDEANAELDKKITVLKNAFEESHQQWMKTQKKTAPALINLACDIAEKIIGSKPENDSNIVAKLENELRQALKKLDDRTKTVLQINKANAEIVQKMLKQYEDQLTVRVEISETCTSGEFVLENKETKVVRDIKLLLNEFKNNISIPAEWLDNSPENNGH